MRKTIRIRLNANPIEVVEGTTVAVALLAAGSPVMRRSVTGAPRGPLCGMGICFECRVTIDGIAHVKGCQTPCREGMEVTVDEL